jgi:hypothetical protein
MYLIQPIQINYLSIIYSHYLKYHCLITLPTHLLQCTRSAKNID